MSKLRSFHLIDKLRFNFTSRSVHNYEKVRVSCLSLTDSTNELSTESLLSRCVKEHYSIIFNFGIFHQNWIHIHSFSITQLHSFPETFFSENSHRRSRKRNSIKNSWIIKYSKLWPSSIYFWVNYSTNLYLASVPSGINHNSDPWNPIKWLRIYMSREEIDDGERAWKKSL